MPDSNRDHFDFVKLEREAWNLFASSTLRYISIGGSFVSQFLRPSVCNDPPAPSAHAIARRECPMDEDFRPTI